MLHVKPDLWLNPAHVVTVGLMELGNGDLFIVANMTNTAPIGLQKVNREWDQATITRIVGEWAEWFRLAIADGHGPSALAII